MGFASIHLQIFFFTHSLGAIRRRKYLLTPKPCSLDKYIQNINKDHLTEIKQAARSGVGTDYLIWLRLTSLVCVFVCVLSREQGIE